MDDLGFFAVTPLWVRLIVLYVTVGLALSLYEDHRVMGASIVAAIGETLLAAILAPVTAVRLLIAGWTTPKT